MSVYEKTIQETCLFITKMQDRDKYIVCVHLGAWISLELLLAQFYKVHVVVLVNVLNLVASL